MSERVPAPPERKVIMGECHLGGVSGGLTVSSSWWGGVWERGGGGVLMLHYERLVTGRSSSHV